MTTDPAYTPEVVADEMFIATLEGQGFDALTPEGREKCMVLLALRAINYINDRTNY